MSDDLEKRMTAMERVQDRLLTTLDQINNTLLKFERHIDELFDLKTKIDTIDVLWRRIDELQTKCGTVDTAFQILKSEHGACKPIVDTIAACKMDFDHRLKDIEKRAETSNAFTSKLFSNLLEKAIWTIVVIGAMSAVYLAGKGAFVR